MAKLLNGKELSLFVKEQQAREVRSLKQSKGVEPKLAHIAAAEAQIIEEGDPLPRMHS